MAAILASGATPRSRGSLTLCHNVTCSTPPRDLRLEQFELPRPEPNEVHLRSRLGAISTGTESAWYFGTDPQMDPNFKPVRYQPPVFPKFLGYEKVAEVVALGSGAKGLAVGQRVIAPYGHAREQIWPAAKLAPSLTTSKTRKPSSRPSSTSPPRRSAVRRCSSAPMFSLRAQAWWGWPALSRPGSQGLIALS